MYSESSLGETRGTAWVGGGVEEWRSEASTGDSSRGLSHTSEVSSATLPLEMIYAWLFH